MAIRPDDVVALLMFARVVEHRSFTEAARALGVAKSVVSARVTRLEAKMGVRLLHRTTRLVTLTADGAALYQRCLRLIADAEDAEQCAAGAAPGPRGLLRVNAPVTFGLLYLARPVTEFLGRHPDVKIDLSLSDRFVDVAGEGLDVVIRIATRLEDSNLHARKLASDRRVVCGAPDYLARKGTPRTPADLAEHNCLGYSLAGGGDEWRLGAGAVPATGNLSADNGLLLKQAALGGLGLVVLPSFLVAEELAAGSLVAILGDLAPIELGIHALHAHGALVPAKVRVFVDFLVEHFRRPPWSDTKAISPRAGSPARPARSRPTRSAGARRPAAPASDR